MIDVTKDKLVSDVYKFVAYFDCKGCIPSMGADGRKNLDSCDRYYMSPYSIKHKIRKYLQYIGRDILHVDGMEERGKTIKERLIGDEPIKNYTADELLKKELEYEDIRMFGTMDVADDFKVRGYVSGPITIMQPRTLDPVIIQENKSVRSYSVLRDDEGKNIGSDYGNPYWNVEYGLFEMYGGVNLSHVKQYGLTESDLDDFFEGLWHMFDFDASDMRPAGSMNMRKLVVWKISPEMLKTNQLFSNQIYENSIYKLKNDTSIISGFDDYEYKKPFETEGIRMYVR